MCPRRLLFVDAIEVLDLARVRGDALENLDVVPCTNVAILLVEHLIV